MERLNNPVFIYSLFSSLIFFWIAISDLTSRKVPNIALLMLTLLVFNFLPYSNTSLVISLSILILGLVAFQKKWLGAGDSKLLAICAYAAQADWLEFLFITALSGGVLAVLVLLYNYLITCNVITGKTMFTLPYAVAIISGAVFTIPYMEIP